MFLIAGPSGMEVLAAAPAIRLHAERSDITHTRLVTEPSYLPVRKLHLLGLAWRDDGDYPIAVEKNERRRLFTGLLPTP